MFALARRRCFDIPNITLLKADAIDFPPANNSMDAAVAGQVYEYIDHLERALTELHRILRPGGRAVVYDTDFDSLVWHSTDPERMRSLCDAFNDHCPRPHLGMY